MHRIYNLAEKVIAWLGPSDEASNLAYYSMTRIQKLPGRLRGPAVPQEFDKAGSCNDKDCFRKLMDRPYWSRAWIVQEMMFARSLVIQCGSEVVLYSTLEESHPPGSRASVSDLSEEGEVTRTSFRGDSEVKILRLGSKQISPKHFLDCFLDRQCLQRHDNIFAFLNLLSDDIREKILLDYKIEIRELVRHTARVFIESTQSLYIIVIRGRQTPPCSQEDEKWQLNMPSWCPFWARPYQCCAIEPKYQASLFSEKAVFSFLDYRLRVKGFIIGKVMRTISRCIQPGDRANTEWGKADIDRERVHYWKCLRLGLIGKPRDSHTTQMSIEATARTLFAGRVKGLSDVLGYEEDVENHPRVDALREIWNKGKSRLVCSFRLGRAAKKALYSSKTAPAGWINRIALVPRTVRPGDAICTILGCPTPVVLRRMGKRYQVLGEAYIDTTAMGRFKVTVRLRDFILK